METGFETAGFDENADAACKRLMGVREQTPSWWQATDFAGFFEQYAWLHREKLTSFFKLSTHLRIPNQWVKALALVTNADIHKLIIGQSISASVAKTIPGSLQDFFAYCKRLSYPHRSQLAAVIPDAELTDSDGQPHYFPAFLRKGMNVKKEHEVARLSHSVHLLCIDQQKQNKISVILDVGSGLGHVDRVLASRHGYRVLAFEADECRTARAREIAKKLAKESGSKTLENLSFHTLRLSTTESACNVIAAELHDAGILPTEPVMLIGLHCCGDLSIVLIDLFRCLQQNRRSTVRMICIGCCYHLTTLPEKCPISIAGREAFGDAVDAHNSHVLTRHSMRLATQGSKSLWFDPCDDADHHILAHFYRCIFEYVLSTMPSSEAQRIQSHVSNIKHYASFDAFIDSVWKCYVISDVNFDAFKLAMHDAKRKFEPYYGHLRAFRALQGSLQRALESFTVWDRLLYLQEDHQTAEISVVPVFDSDISPRNLALVATLTTQQLESATDL